MTRTRIALVIACLIVAACAGATPGTFVSAPSPVASAVAPTAAAPSAGRPAARPSSVFVLLKATDGTRSIGAFSAAAGKLMAQSPVGVPSADWSTIHVATVEGETTSVQAFDTQSGNVTGQVVVDGSWELPSAVPGELPDGLARSAGIIILHDTAVPVGTSRFALLGTSFAAPPRMIEFKGSFVFDAVAPNGRYVFFIERLGDAGSSHYQVRAYDTTVRQLLEGAIVDKREIGESMEGAPIARATSADGQWAYTLYVKDDGTAFVHQLDTLNALALCADLPGEIRSTTPADREAWRIGLTGNDMPLVANGRLGLIGRVDMGEVGRVDRLPATLTGLDLGLALGSGGRAYLAGPTAVSVMDTGTLKLLGLAPAAASGGAVVSDDGKSLFAAAFGPGSASLEWFDLASGLLTSVGSVPLSGINESAAWESAAWLDAQLIGATTGG